MAEWLRRLTRNQMRSFRAFLFYLAYPETHLSTHSLIYLFCHLSTCFGILSHVYFLSYMPNDLTYCQFIYASSAYSFTVLFLRDYLSIHLSICTSVSPNINQNSLHSIYLPKSQRRRGKSERGNDKRIIKKDSEEET